MEAVNNTQIVENIPEDCTPQEKEVVVEEKKVEEVVEEKKEEVVVEEGEQVQSEVQTPEEVKTPEPAAKEVEEAEEAEEEEGEEVEEEKKEEKVEAKPKKEPYRAPKENCPGCKLPFTTQTLASHFWPKTDGKPSTTKSGQCHKCTQKKYLGADGKLYEKLEKQTHMNCKKCGEEKTMRTMKKYPGPDGKPSGYCGKCLNKMNTPEKTKTEKKKEDKVPCQGGFCGTKDAPNHFLKATLESHKIPGTDKPAMMCFNCWKKHYGPKKGEVKKTASTPVEVRA